MHLARRTRTADLLPVGYFHVVFTLPAEIADIAFQNKGVIYDLLFKAASETMLTIAADPKHLGARIGITAVLHTWGSAMTHHPHVHMIVPGGGIAPDGKRWISSRLAFLLPVRVLCSLFRRLFLTRLMALHQSGKLAFFGHLVQLADRRAFLRHISLVKKKRWVVYAKPPFGGVEAVLAYLARYTHRVAISNRRLIAFDDRGVTLRFKDYRRDSPDRQQVMTLPTDEFIRRFLAHVLRVGSSASGTMGYSPRHRAKPASRLHASCSMLRHHQTMRTQSNLTMPPAMPLLWRAHGRHRSVRTLATTPRAAILADTNPRACVMTRHGPRRSPAQAIPLRAAVPLALRIRDTASMAMIWCEGGQQQRGVQSSKPNFTDQRTLSGNRPCTAFAATESEIPIDHRLPHAGPCM